MLEFPRHSKSYIPTHFSQWKLSRVGRKGGREWHHNGSRGIINTSVDRGFQYKWSERNTWRKTLFHTACKLTCKDWYKGCSLQVCRQKCGWQQHLVIILVLGTRMRPFWTEQGNIMSVHLLDEILCPFLTVGWQLALEFPPHSKCHIPQWFCQW